MSLSCAHEIAVGDAQTRPVARCDVRHLLGVLLDQLKRTTRSEGRVELAQTAQDDTVEQHPGQRLELSYGLGSQVALHVEQCIPGELDLTANELR